MNKRETYNHLLQRNVTGRAMRLPWSWNCQNAKRTLISLPISFLENELSLVHLLLKCKLIKPLKRPIYQHLIKFEIDLLIQQFYGNLIFISLLS